jgi:hypothetical protein
MQCRNDVAEEESQGTHCFGHVRPRESCATQAMRLSCGHMSHGCGVCCAIAKAGRISVSRAEPIGRCGIPCRWTHVCVARGAESQIVCGGCAVMEDRLGRAGGMRGRGEPMQRLVATGTFQRVWDKRRVPGPCVMEGAVGCPDLACPVVAQEKAEATQAIYAVGCVLPVLLASRHGTVHILTRQCVLDK